MKQLCRGSAEVWNNAIFLIRIRIKKPSAGIAGQNCASHALIIMISHITLGFRTLQELNKADSVEAVNRKIRCYGPPNCPQL
jgi:hypothetical protein